MAVSYRAAKARRPGLRGGPLWVLLVGVLGLCLTGQIQAQTTLRIGYQKYGSLVLLKASGALEKRLQDQDIKVQWTEFPAGPQLLEGLNVGSVDFGMTGETPPIFAQAAGADLLYVAHDQPAPYSEALLVQKDSSIRSVADLKGKKVALNKGSNVHYLLLQALREAGLKYRDIQPVYLPPADARAAFQRGSVAAWVIWDPFLAAAEKQLGARVLRDGRQLVDNHQFYLATRPFVKAHPQVIEAVVEEIRRVGEWTLAHPDQATSELAPILGLPVDITRVALTRQGFATTWVGPEVVQAQQKIADAFAELKLIPQPLRVGEVVWPGPK